MLLDLLFDRGFEKSLLMGWDGTTWESVSMTKDMAGLSFSPAFVAAAIAG